MTPIRARPMPLFAVHAGSCARPADAGVGHGRCHRKARFWRHGLGELRAAVRVGAKVQFSRSSDERADSLEYRHQLSSRCGTSAFMVSAISVSEPTIQLPATAAEPQELLATLSCCFVLSLASEASCACLSQKRSADRSRREFPWR